VRRPPSHMSAGAMSSPARVHAAGLFLRLSRPIMERAARARYRRRPLLNAVPPAPIMVRREVVLSARVCCRQVCTTRGRRSTPPC